MITLHHLENSRSQRILWLLEELGVDYEIKLYKRDPKTNLAPDELKAIHPLGKSPLITDGGKVVAESAVIVNYLIRNYDKDNRFSSTQDSDAAQQTEYWLHFDEGSLMPYLVMSLVYMRYSHSNITRLVTRLVTRLGCCNGYKGHYKGVTLVMSGGCYKLVMVQIITSLSFWWA